MSLRDELMSVRAAYGALTPPLVVEAARSPQHPLHARFEWDDSIAAEAYRLVQARELIRAVRVGYRTEDGEPRSVREFHSVQRGDASPAYEPVNEILEDELATRVLMNSMRREWRALKRRYERFAEFRALVLGDLGPDDGEAQAI